MQPGMKAVVAVLVVALKDPYNIVRALRGEKIGTIVKEA